MSSPFRWAVMGPGKIAHQFAKALAGVPGAVLYAVGSRDIDRARAFAAEYKAEAVYGSYEELVRDGNVDAVYIATPHVMHCDNAVLCLERGIPVLCEKPISINARFERRMAQAARSNSAFLMEAMWSRFLPAARHARSLIESGAIGEPRMLSADFSFSAPPDPASRLFDPALAGGGLLDVGCYVMALSSMVFGPHPVETAAFAHIGSTGVDEHAALLLKYPGGGISSLTCGVHAVGSGDAHIMGTEGHITLSPFWKAESVRVVKGQDVEDIPFPFIVNGFEYEIMEVMDCVRKGLIESPLMPLDESVAIMETMDDIRRSWGLEYPTERQ
jgi:dihydrodiol dehydrogenase / D-xylose 1-dehydrogenase (NADP)